MKCKCSFQKSHMSCPPLYKNFDLGDRDKQVVVHFYFIFSIIIPLQEKRMWGARKLLFHGGVLPPFHSKCAGVFVCVFVFVWCDLPVLLSTKQRTNRFNFNHNHNATVWYRGQVELKPIKTFFCLRFKKRDSQHDMVNVVIAHISPENKTLLRSITGVCIIIFNDVKII